MQRPKLKLGAELKCYGTSLLEEQIQLCSNYKSISINTDLKRIGSNLI